MSPKSRAPRVSRALESTFETKIKPAKKKLYRESFDKYILQLKFEFGIKFAKW